MVKVWHSLHKDHARTLVQSQMAGEGNPRREKLFRCLQPRERLRRKNPKCVNFVCFETLWFIWNFCVDLTGASGSWGKWNSLASDPDTNCVKPYITKRSEIIKKGLVQGSDQASVLFSRDPSWSFSHQLSILDLQSSNKIVQNGLLST